MKGQTKWVMGTVGIVVAAALLVNPRLTNPPADPRQDFLASNAPPVQVAATLRNACYDCHSQETRWPWYSHVAPVSWWLADHVKEGRRHLNFSQWPYDDSRRAAKWFRRIADTVESGDMPLRGYDKMHPAAKLDSVQRKELAGWAQSEADRVSATTEGGGGK